MLYKDWLNLWLENYVKPVIKTRSYFKYKRDVSIHILPSLGKYELEELTPLVLQKFTVELANKKLATGTINGIISVLKNSIKSANNAEITVKNHTNSIIRPKICEKQVDSFSKQEQEKIEHKGFHSLRHTFAIHAIECGMNVKCLSEILGHKNPTITLKRYAHSILEYKTEMMNKIGKILCI